MTWIVALWTGWLLTLGASMEPNEPDPLVVMTFNLRFASPRPPNAWPVRRPVVAALIRQYRPDVIGTQEGVFSQLKDMARDLPDYAWIGLGREGGSRGEFMAVFYRKDRLDPVEFDHFWLSDTPNVIGSRTWGNPLPRMATWVRFRDRRDDTEFYVLNTHFSHVSEPARRKSAALVRDRVNRFEANVPAFVLGDFNAAAETSEPYRILVADSDWADTWELAQQRGPAIGTFHNYQGPRPGGARIDWILTRPSAPVISTEIITFSRDGQYPSDHFPVVARVRLGRRSP